MSTQCVFLIMLRVPSRAKTGSRLMGQPGGPVKQPGRSRLGFMQIGRSFSGALCSAASQSLSSSPASRHRDSGRIRGFMLAMKRSGDSECSNIWQRAGGSATATVASKHNLRYVNITSDVN